MAAMMNPRDVSSDESSTTTPDVELSSNDVNKTLARKRRIELRNKQRSSDDSSAEEPAAKRPRGEAAIVVDPVVSEETDAKPSITGIKRQHRYDPGVSMTREELKAWRKEARRVRNRESAAASRQKNRARVNELEEEVEALKSKYAAALQWIVKLEAAAAVNDSFTPAILRQDVRELAQSTPCPPEDIQTVSPPATPPTSSRIVELGQPSQVDEKYQHIMNMISQPAVKISDVGTSQDSVEPVPVSSTSPFEMVTYGGDIPSEVFSTVSASDQSDLVSDIDESALGEFLLDTFEAVDARDASWAPMVA